MWYSAVGCLVTLTLSLLTTPLAADAQPAGKVWRIGVLTGGADPESPRGASFRQGLRELGYVEGQNIAIEWRLSGGSAERFSDLAAGDVNADGRADLVVIGVSEEWGLESHLFGLRPERIAASCPTSLLIVRAHEEVPLPAEPAAASAAGPAAAPDLQVSGAR